MIKDTFKGAAIRHLILACVLIALTACQPMYFRTLNTGLDGAVLSVEYAPSIWLDVYRPPPAFTSTPVVLFLYGGSWQSGKREQYAFVGAQLANAGVLALVADYRLFPEVTFPAFVHDSAQAVAWARQNATRFRGDPERLFVAGHSAGAQIAALLATDPSYLAAVGMRPDDLAGMIGIAGPYDFLPLTDPDLVDVFGAPEQWPASQPVNFVSGNEPPILLLHGTGDKLVWLRNSQRFAARLSAAGADVEFKAYPGVGHVRILASLRFVSLAPALADMLEFMQHRGAHAPLESTPAPALTPTE